MTPAPRSLAVLVAAVVWALLAVGVTPADAVAPTSSTKVVGYRGITVRVPAEWPVVDLDANPGTCVRLDRSVVYLGAASAQQDCPAHAVGRADTVWLGPSTAADRSADTAEHTRSVRHGGLDLRVRRDDTARQQDVAVPSAGVTLRTAWADDARTVDLAVATLAGGAAPAPTATDAGPLVPSTTTPTAPSSTAALAASPSTGTLLTGMSFDTCAAPTTSTMATWKTFSPYAAVGIYIGGSQRACGDGNLSSSWVSTVTSQGWGLIPIYVGLQAPCFSGSAATFTAANAASTGMAAAADAASRAAAFGIPRGSALVYDIENYDVPNAACTAAVLNLVTAWTEGIHRAGYLSGVYGNIGSLMTDMSSAVASHDAFFTPPDHVWYARWDGLQTTTNGTSFPGFPDGYWNGHSRHHQYRGDFLDTWGGVHLNIDADWSDAPVPGRPTQVDYGTNTLGPGSGGFVFTGDMTFWRPMPGEGLKGRAYWTGASTDGTESNGATWSPTLGTAIYAVDVNVPASSPANTTGTARYTLTDLDGSRVVNLDQSTATGWRTLGKVVARGGVSPVLHLADIATSTSRFVADAARFRLLAKPPSSPTGVGAAAGPARATVAWSAAAANGATVSGYTVTASPGGATRTVSGSARSTTVTGLANGTAYTFTVRATNLAGTGAESSPSGAVTPLAGGRVTAVAPVRLLDTRVGTTANPRHTALAPGESLTLRVAGVTSSPVPAGATAAQLNLTVTGGTSAGNISVGASGTVASAVNYVARQTVANLTLARLAADGTVRVTNNSSGSVHLIADVQGQVSPGTTGGLWNQVTPVRLVDTRVGTGSNPRRTALGPGESLVVTVAGITGSPVPAGAKSAALNLTSTAPTTAGYLSVSDGASTTASVVNFGVGQTVANLALAKLATNGTVTVRNGSTGTVQLVLDVQGYAGSSGRTTSPAPLTRLLDTRSGATANPRVGVLQPGASVTVVVTGVNGTNVPASAAAALVNLTVVGPTRNGQLAVSDGAASGGSLGNFSAGATVATLAFAKLSTAGSFVVTNQSAGSLNLIVDSQGFVGP